MRQVLRRDPIYWEDSLVQSVFSIRYPRTREGPGKPGRFPSAIAECSESVPSCIVSFAYAFT